MQQTKFRVLKGQDLEFETRIVRHGAKEQTEWLERMATNGLEDNIKLFAINVAITTLVRCSRSIVALWN